MAQAAKRSGEVSCITQSTNTDTALVLFVDSYLMPYCLVLICTIVGLVVGGSILFKFRDDVQSAADKHWVGLDDSEQNAADAV